MRVYTYTYIYIYVTYKEAGGGEEKKSSFNVLSPRQGIYRENTQVIGDTTDRFVPRKREQTSNEFAFRCELLLDRPSFFVQFVFVQLSAIIKLEQVYIYIYIPFLFSRFFSPPAIPRTIVRVAITAALGYLIARVDCYLYSLLSPCPSVGENSLVGANFF